MHGEFTQSTQLIRQVLKRRIHELKGEDQAWIELIRRNGIKNVPDEDLQELSRDRGMRAIGLTRERLEKQYQDWIELSTDPNISVSLSEPVHQRISILGFNVGLYAYVIHAQSN